MPSMFNRALDLKLLQLVKENDVLYNIKSKHYQDIDTREVIWQKIGDALNRPASACRTRWVNIRDMMRKKLRKRLLSPAEAKGRYKYEEEMSFIIPYFKDFPDTSMSATDEYLETDDHDNNDNDDSSFHQQDFAPDPLRKSEAAGFLETEDHGGRFQFSLANSPEREQKVSAVQIVEERETLNPADPLDVFLLTIGATLRKFSPYYLNQAKSKIFQVVQDYELKQIDGPNKSEYL